MNTKEIAKLSDKHHQLEATIINIGDLGLANALHKDPMFVHDLEILFADLFKTLKDKYLVMWEVQIRESVINPNSFEDDIPF